MFLFVKMVHFMRLSIIIDVILFDSFFLPGSAFNFHLSFWICIPTESYILCMFVDFAVNELNNRFLL